ncbi:MAG: glycoside hydrolase family 16 protein [Kibdelosporangium sp.]
MRFRFPRRAGALGIAGLSVLTLAAVPATAAPGQTLFDDFAYSSSSDSRLRQRGWEVRSGGGGPGVGSWDPGLITFSTLNGSTVMQLGAATNGTAGGTRQSQINTGRKFKDGTYAARVEFTDGPTSGPDGNHVVQTFYTITPLRYAYDPDYGEQDFEYLPNGGWGEPSNTMFLTSWETYRADPWDAVNVSTASRRSFAGWHNLVLQVMNGRMRYYIDGALVADHGDQYYPETPQLINFNQWFIDLTGASGSTARQYRQRVDYVYFARDEALSPAQVDSRIGGLRSAGTTFTDNVSWP